jgi:hypothetical protein
LKITWRLQPPESNILGGSHPSLPKGPKPGVDGSHENPIRTIVKKLIASIKKYISE